MGSFNSSNDFFQQNKYATQNISHSNTIKTIQKIKSNPMVTELRIFLFIFRKRKVCPWIAISSQFLVLKKSVFIQFFCLFISTEQRVNLSWFETGERFHILQTIHTSNVPSVNVLFSYQLEIIRRSIFYSNVLNTKWSLGFLILALYYKVGEKYNISYV